MERLCERLRGLVNECLSDHLYTSAAFYADKLVTLSNGAPGDVYLLAETYFLSKQHRRALMLLKKDGLIEQDLRFRHLAALCLAECKDWEECLTVLGDGNDVEDAPSTKDHSQLGHTVSLQANLCLLRARAYQATDNRPRAIHWYRQALNQDAYCYEAFAALIEGHLLTCEEEVDLCNELRVLEEDRWLDLLLRAKCKKYNLQYDMDDFLAELEAPCSTAGGTPLVGTGAGQQGQQSASGAQADTPSSLTATISPPSRSLHGRVSNTGPVASQQQQQSAAAGLGAAGGSGAGGAIRGAAAMLSPPSMQQGGHQAGPAWAHQGPSPSPMVEGTPMSVSMSPYPESTPGAGPTPVASLGPVGAGQGAGRGTPSKRTSSEAGAGRSPRRSSGTGAGDGMGPTPGPGSQQQQQRADLQLTPPSLSSMGDVDMEAETPQPLHLATPVFNQQGARAGQMGGQHGPPFRQDSLTGQHQGFHHGAGPGALSFETPMPMSTGGAGLGAGCETGGTGGPGSTAGGVQGCGLKGNIDVLACKADWLYHKGAYEACHALCSKALEVDPYALQVLPLALSCALVLGRRSELFMRGHKLVEEYPGKAVAWFAVGCYYMSTRQYDTARRYFSKATSLDPGFAPAWIAFGHAFSAQDERDQAMAAYRTAARLFPGLHLPVLGMGMEYSAMNNLQLAERMLLASHELCPSDPVTCHELGVCHYKAGVYEAASAWLRTALDLMAIVSGGSSGQDLSARVGDGSHFEAYLAGNSPHASGLGSGMLSNSWEPTALVLGHCLRKRGDLQEALQWYQRALAQNPGQPGTLSALGYTYQLMGQMQAAIEAYHSALAIKPDDPFTVDMLNVALVEFGRQQD